MYLNKQNDKLCDDVSEHDLGGSDSGHPASIEKSFLFLDDEGERRQADRHEVGDGEDDAGGHELGERSVVRPVDRLLERDRKRSLNQNYIGKILID